MCIKNINSFMKYVVIGYMTLFYCINGLFAEIPGHRDEITIYVVPTITDEKILPMSFISYDYISDSISIVASPGEYEPASFVVRANENITSLQVNATELSGDNGSIPDSNIDISVVKCWYQAGYNIWDLTHKHLTPELLLKDNSLVKVEGEENYLKLITGEYKWISEKGEGPQWTTGKFGSGLQYDGVDDCVNCGNDTSLNLDGKDYTYTLWIKPGMIPKNRSFFHRGYYNKGFILKYNDGIWFEVKDEDGYNTFNVPLTVSEKWYFIAYVVKQNQEHKAWIYDESGLVDSCSKSLNGLTRDADGSYLRFSWTTGWTADSESQYAGLIDEARIYSRALSSYEIYTLYNENTANDSALVGHWDFNENSGDTAYDKSTYGNNGRLMWYENRVIPIDSLPVKDSPILQPLNISNGLNKQFWITIKVPENTLPGIYTGKIELKNSAVLVGEIHLKLEVLPIELSNPYLTYSLYYEGQFHSDWPEGSISSVYKSEEQFRAEQKDMFNHGVTNPTVRQGFDETLLGKVLDIRNETGMGGQPLYYHGGQTGNPSDSAELEMLKDRVIETIEFVEPYGITDVYFYGIDEAKAEKLASQRPAWEAVHEVGGKIFASGYTAAWWPPGNFALMGDIQDLLVCAGKPYAEEAAKWHSVNHKIFCYAYPQIGPEKPETFRRNFGLLLWQADYDGAMDFAYQFSNLSNIWNDFGDCQYRDHNFTYPTMDGIIGTIQWEGWREGVDDIKYLTTLIDVVQQAGAQGQDTSIVMEWIGNLKCSDLSALDLNVIRETMIGYIVAFTVGSPSDTIPPVITDISHSYINSLSAINITWKTDERSNSQVEYGRSIGLGDSTVIHIPFFYKHSVPISNIEPDTVYYFRVKSIDTSGNLAISCIDSFSTSTSSDVPILFIPPTDTNSAVVHRDWTEIKTSINSIYETSSFIDWDRSLVSYWDFNEDSGSITYDKSTYDNNGILINTCWTIGSRGSSVEFNGENSCYVNCGNDISLNCDTAITIEGWFYPKTYVTGYAAHPIQKWSSTADANYVMYFYGTTSSCYKCIVFWGNAGGVWQQLSYDYPIYNLNTWYHFAWTYSSEEGGKLYINGELYGNPVGQSAGLLTMNTDSLILGKENFNGMLDEIRIWKRILSPNEIKASYNASVHSRSILFSDLTEGYYQYYAYVIDLFGNKAQTETRIITIASSAIKKNVGNNLPKIYSLSRNYPNPFEAITRFDYFLPHRSKVNCSIYNILGQKVKILVNEMQDSGIYSIYWNGTDSWHKKCPCGIYFYRFKAGNYLNTKKLLLIR